MITTKSRISIRLNEEDGFTFELCSPEVFEIFQRGYWTRYVNRNTKSFSRFGKETIGAVKEIYDQIVDNKQFDFYGKDSYPSGLNLGFFSHMLSDMFKTIHINQNKTPLNFGLQIDQYQENNWLVNHGNKSLNYVLLFDNTLDKGIIDSYEGIQSINSLKKIVGDYSRVISSMIKTCDKNFQANIKKAIPTQSTGIDFSYESSILPASDMNMYISETEDELRAF